MPHMDYAVELGQDRCHDIVMTKYRESCTIDEATGCWFFKGSRNTDGYGQVFAKKSSRAGLGLKLSLGVNAQRLHLPNAKFRARIAQVLAVVELIKQHSRSSSVNLQMQQLRI
ncbi:hypothetical protein VTN96DRAFT_2180 [Rasamsonia emersonii]